MSCDIIIASQARAILSGAEGGVGIEYGVWVWGMGLRV